MRIWISWLQTFLYSFFLKVAIKSIRKEKIKDEQDLVHIRREIEIMSTLCHPHIITIYEGTALKKKKKNRAVCPTRLIPSHTRSETWYLKKDFSQSVFVWDLEFGHASLCAEDRC